MSGVTYRRVPVLSIGRDLYPDNSSFLQAINRIAGSKALATSSADTAYEAFGYKTFWLSLPLVSSDLITPALAKDRAALFRALLSTCTEIKAKRVSIAVFSRPDFKDLGTNGLSEIRIAMNIVEKEYLKNSPFIGGDKPSVADIHTSWMIKWALETLDVKSTPGFGPDKFPKVHNWSVA